MELLTEIQQSLTDAYKEKHSLADDRIFATWVRVPFSRSRKSWSAVAFLCFVAIAAVILGPTLWALGIGIASLLLLPLFNDKQFLSWGPDGARLHENKASQFDQGRTVALDLGTEAERVLNVDGERFQTSASNLETLVKLSEMDDDEIALAS